MSWTTTAPSAAAASISAPRARTRGMDDRLEGPALRLVGEHDRAHRRPVELALGGEDSGPKAATTSASPSVPAADHLARQQVGVDHHRPELGQHRGDGALARADATGQSHAHAGTLLV